MNIVVAICFFVSPAVLMAILLNLEHRHLSVVCAAFPSHVSQLVAVGR